MREVTGWYEDLSEAEGISQDAVRPLQKREFFDVELALTFMADHFPDEPVDCLWSMLSHYIVPRPGDAVMAGRLHRLGLLLGRYRSGSRWLRSLGEYDKLSERLRAFRRLPTRGQSEDGEAASARYRMRDPAALATRFELYRAVIDRPVPYAPPRVTRAAEPGEVYRFTNSFTGSDEMVAIPKFEIPVELRSLPLLTARRRRPVRLTPRMLRQAAQRMDRVLANRPDIPERNFAGRLRKVAFQPWSPEMSRFRTKPTGCSVRGLVHGIGLPNSGKTSYALIGTYAAVRRGHTVVLVLPSVSDCLQKTALFRALGVKAVPIFGSGSRFTHASGYWRGVLADHAPAFPSVADVAADYVSCNCLLEPFRDAPGGKRPPLPVKDFPCREKLLDAEDKQYNCPLLAICPVHRAEQEMAGADVWLTTPQALLVSWAQPVHARLRWLEAVQHWADLLIVDEADKVQQTLDAEFLQSQVLVAQGGSWWDQEVITAQNSLRATGRRPLEDRRAMEYYRFKGKADDEVNLLYNALLEPDKDGGSARLRKHLHETYFSGHSLFNDLARLLHGLSPNGEGPQEQEEKALEYYRKNFETFVFHTFDPVTGPLQAIVPDLENPALSEEELRKRVDAWLIDHARAAGGPEAERKLGRYLPFARHLLRAAYHTSLLGSSYLRMATIRPAVEPLLGLSRDEEFWSSRPPSDYDAFVPEALQGNMLAFQWLDNRAGSGDLRIFWVRGVGRWLLHHMHDLLAAEGIEGPNVLLLSATSWAGDSATYHVDVPVDFLLREPDEDREAIACSRFHFRPARTLDGRLVSPSGRLGDERQEAVRGVAASVAPPGGREGLLASVLERLPPQRRKALLVAQSGNDARTTAEYLVRGTAFTAQHVVKDAETPGPHGIQRRDVHRFGLSEHDVLTAAQLSIERAVNVLNADGVAAFGAEFFLSRQHPPPDELDLAMGLSNRSSMAKLLHPALAPASIARAAAELRKESRMDWHLLVGRPVVFRRLRGRAHRAFVWNSITSMWQTICRCIRGGQPVEVYFCDPAFAPRHARHDTAADTANTSILVAMERALRDKIRPSEPVDERDRAAAEVLYELMLQCLENMDWGQ
ncbi:hypothetical protein ADK77_41250 [Streptomyces antibioticus]|nr:hypothetical protein [Streptomyces antibioticus]KOG59208.1 hypothetical protein ADK77_41250 [Streptomyces antibioticus]